MSKEQESSASSHTPSVVSVVVVPLLADMKEHTSKQERSSRGQEISMSRAPESGAPRERPHQSGKNSKEALMPSAAAASVAHGSRAPRGRHMPSAAAAGVAHESRAPRGRHMPSAAAAGVAHESRAPRGRHMPSAAAAGVAPVSVRGPMNFEDRKHKTLRMLEKLREEKAGTPDEQRVIEAIEKLQLIREEPKDPKDIRSKENNDSIYSIFFNNEGLWVEGSSVDSIKHMPDAFTVGLKVFTKVGEDERMIRIASYYKRNPYNILYPKGSLDRDDVENGAEFGFNQPTAEGLIHKNNLIRNLDTFVANERMFYLSGAKREFNEETGVDIASFITNPEELLETMDFIERDIYDPQTNQKIRVDRVGLYFKLELSNDQYYALVDQIRGVDEREFIDPEVYEIYFKKYLKYKTKYSELKKKII
jgi:hypothetical protein